MKDKLSLRKEYKEKRANLSEEEVHDLSIQIANNLLKLNIWDKNLYHLFLTINSQNEVQTEYILRILQGRDKDIAISKSDFETNELRHFLLTDNTVIKVNPYGIPEPSGKALEVSVTDIDVVFIPLLAIDVAGNRIGYGKGFYDRFLAQCRPDCVKIGISFFPPLDFQIVTDDFDIPVNHLITPEGVYHFST